MHAVLTELRRDKNAGMKKVPRKEGKRGGREGVGKWGKGRDRVKGWERGDGVVKGGREGKGGRDGKGGKGGSLH